MYAYLILGDNKKLSVLELLSLSKENKFILDKKLILLSKAVDFSRLAYIKKSYFVVDIFDSGKNIEDGLNKKKLNKLYKNDFCVRRINLTDKEVPSEIELSSIIWRNVSNPKVNLSNPSTRFEFVFTDKKVYLLLLLAQQDKKSMLLRWPHNRPAFHPTSMTPPFALMLVNLAGAKKGDLFLDPFCGVGGILIEAGLLGCKIIGYDKDPKMISYAKKNLDYFKINNYTIEQKDALEITKKVDYIVTDLPYGRHSKLFGKKTKNLASAFLEKAAKVISKKGRVVLVCPSTIDVDFGDFRLVDYLDYYIHSSLTRRVYILEKR